MTLPCKQCEIDNLRFTNDRMSSALAAAQSILETAHSGCLPGYAKHAEWHANKNMVLKEIAAILLDNRQGPKRSVGSIDQRESVAA